MTATTAAIFGKLQSHRGATLSTTLRDLIAADAARFDQFSVRAGDLLLDFSKSHLNRETVSLLGELVHVAGVAERRARMYAGDRINETERRAVLHVALRDATDRRYMVDGSDVASDIAAVLKATGDFAEGVRSGAIRAQDGGRFNDVVNIGIGGSDLGPAMAVRALSPYHDGPRVHFVSNVDGAHLADTLRQVDPARTLFLIASKTFTTIETMTNARTARAFVVEALGEKAVGQHFAAMSTALDKVDAFGISRERTFGFWDWVGGRYSVWSAIGLPLMIAIGRENYRRFLDGGHDMDVHFETAPFAENLPMLLGAIGVWHRVICAYPTRAVLPYDQRLGRLPAHLQQLEMESNGKRVTLEGEPVERPTGAVVWGEPGTDGQHAFFQMLHQGTDVVPCEFLVAAQGHEPDLVRHHQLLMANCLAQSEALAFGRTSEEAAAQMIALGMSAEEAQRLAPHKTFCGNRPSITIAYRKLDPYTLGRLIALYEHRVFVEAAIHNIDAFDQWGVELGKEMATHLLPVVSGDAGLEACNPTTAGLVRHLHGMAEKP